MRGPIGRSALVALGLACLLGAPTALAQSAGDILPLGEDGQAPLEGTSWRLTHYRDGELREAGPEVGAWLTLRGGRIRGSGGCTRIAARYGRVGDAIRITDVQNGEPDCAEQTVMVELGLVAGLTRAASAEVTAADPTGGSTLTIRDAGGRDLLRFRPDDAGPLTGIDWQLERYGSAEVTHEAVTDAPAVLTFVPSGRVDDVERRSSGDAVGSSGCNGFVGRFSRHADVLSFSELQPTDAPCGPNLAAQEETMLAVLDATALLLELPPDRLILTSADTGDWLELASSAPLEGSTWILARVAGRPAPDDTVTLRLDDGILGGEGPCGPYEGRYATDGRFITFSELGGAGDADCPERRLEGAMLSALRNAVVIDRTRSQLRFVDAAGQVRAAFTRPGGP